MNTKHTPGPWVVKHGRDVFKGSRRICNVNAGIELAIGASMNTAEANARLIAAAPDLLEASIEYLAAGENSMNTDDDIAAMIRFGKAEKSMRAAIAKATRSEV